MAVFHKTSKIVMQVNAAVLALFVFGPGLSPPTQASAGPPSSCAAPIHFYDMVALLHYGFLFSIFGSCLLASKAMHIVAGEEDDSLQALSASTALKARASLLLCIALSVAAAGFAVGVYTFVLQIRYTVFQCMPAGTRFLIFGADAVVAIISVYAYASFAWAAAMGV